MIVIGLLRFIGLLNAAVWLGTVFLLVFVAEPATNSEPMRELLGAKSFPYFSGAICHLISDRFLTLFLVCALIALLHTGAEWLYFGKYPRRVWLALIFVLFLGGLAQSYAVQPKLKARLLVQHHAGSRPEERESAGRSFRRWHVLATAINLLLLCGLSTYLWRVANPPDEMRFLGASPAHLPGKFRS